MGRETRDVQEREDDGCELQLAAPIRYQCKRRSAIRRALMLMRCLRCALFVLILLLLLLLFFFFLPLCVS